jgi:hypothetical protein
MRHVVPICVVVVFLAATSSTPASEHEYTDSLRYSCFDHPFLSVSAQVAEHEAFPDVDLRLTDPKGRNTGNGRQDRPIPNSHYGKIVEMPKHPERSKAVAVEVCDAIEGRYSFTVSEHGRGDYIVSVGGDDGKYGK